MNSLQNHIAEFFPVEFSADRWADLLPKFIDHHVALYQKRVDGYELDLANWQKGDQSRAGPSRPIMPEIFVDACVEQANREKLSPRVLAAALYLGRERVTYFMAESEKHRQQSIHDNQLCGEAIDNALELRQLYLDRVAGTTIGKWLN